MRRLSDVRCPALPTGFIASLYRHVLPLARAELAQWRRRAETIPHPGLRRHALASLADKRFHADGGCVFAAAHPRAPALVRLIVALQTISDYLDNLCDRDGSTDLDHFRALHAAMQDAVRPGVRPRPYYRLRGGLEDGGYLADLVRTCQETVAALPGYRDVFPYLSWFIDRYCELQVYKHGPAAERAERLARWASAYRAAFPDVSWWEFAAATGSTLGMFALFRSAAGGGRVPPETLCRAYFPWICGLHILLDYWIDLEEDLREGDFNFVRAYPSPEEAHARLCWFARQSRRQARGLSADGRIHEYVVQGLLCMYLSDAKARQQGAVRPARRMVWAGGPTAWLFYAACKLYRAVR